MEANSSHKRPDLRVESCSSAISDTESFDERNSLVSSEKDESKSANDSGNTNERHQAGVAKIRKTRRNKKKSLPGFPQKSQPSFFFWLNENRMKFQEKYSNFNREDFFKKSNELWNAVEDKSKWEKEAMADQKRYEKELARWNAREKRKLSKYRCNQSESSICSSPIHSNVKISINSISSENSESEVFCNWYGTGSAFKSKEFIDTTHGSSNMDEQSQCGSDDTPVLKKEESYAQLIE